MKSPTGRSTGFGPELQRLVDKARETPMTPAEIDAQRRSYVRAEIAFGSDVHEAAYRAAFDRGDTEEMARLDAEGRQRLVDIDFAEIEKRVLAQNGTLEMLKGWLL